MKKNILFTLLMFTLSINFVFANDNVCQLSKQSNLAGIYYSKDWKNIVYKMTSNDGLNREEFIEKDWKQQEKFYISTGTWNSEKFKCVPVIFEIQIFQNLCRWISGLR